MLRKNMTGLNKTVIETLSALVYCEMDKVIKMSNKIYDNGKIQEYLNR